MGEHPQATEGCCALGIDAAWTVHQPSGIALVQNTATGWSCLGVAPSYEAFITQASGQAWDPEQKATGSRPDPAALLKACQQLDGAAVSCVSVDMPLATTPITSRRVADTAISSRFGPRGCAVHSPSAERPGAIADQLRADFPALGYPLHTNGSGQATPGSDRVLHPCGPTGVAHSRLPRPLQGKPIRQILEKQAAFAASAD